MQNNFRKIFFIINPVSGGKKKHDWESAIREYFRERPENIEFYLLSGKNDETSICNHISRFKPETMVAVGGDGTVNLLAGILKGKEIALGIIPAGSANGMARELGIPQDVQKALDIIVAGHVKKIDLIKLNEYEYCLHLSDVGLNAMLVKYFERSGKRGMGSYAKAVLRILWFKQKMDVTIITDDARLERKAYMVTMANARKYGTGANINPEGDIADGRFEVVVVRKLNVFEILKALFTDRNFHPRRIEVFPTKKLQLLIRKRTYFQIDGEYLGKVNRLVAEIVPHSIRMIIPPQP